METATWQDFTTSQAGSLPKKALVHGTVPVTLFSTQLVPAPYSSSFGGSIVLQLGHGSSDAANVISVALRALACVSFFCPVRR